MSESSPSQWLNLSNCGVVHVLSWKISLVELEKELADIYCKEWPWQIRELEPDSFLVRFPPHRKVADMKNYPSVGLRKPGVQIEILEWVGESVPLEELRTYGFRSGGSLLSGVIGLSLPKSLLGLVSCWR